MAPREPTRAQLSSKLAYQSHKPNFLLKLQNRMNGIPDEEEEGEEGEFEYVGNGREPIPRRPRPPVPERPADDPGSADEEDLGDEKPQVVVLKEGKHLTEWEAESIRRAEKGLAPLPDPRTSAKKPEPASEGSKESSSSGSKSANQGLSFSSGSKPGAKSNKRKAVGQLDELKAELKSKEKEKVKEKGKGPESAGKNSSKKAKKNKKTLLSFGDEA
ncbi:hypothetical protein CPB84DRAFT_1793375 [Gymnopilus junonius]|uniref:DUF4604 domain-containing protein n=1 Tax=Gymnopilus junonius TaxID=109634 RepID=A0A9P5TII7_GYMJU|nr:hypothetical protein CPB84DRAFT_1793375 [Gymnopilus junonius]